MITLFALLTVADSMRYLDNGRIRLGVDLDKGGSITYLAKSGGPNMVNSCDFGRQIQMSFYSGPVPYAPGGKQPAKAWEGLGWNPIQTGDYYGHPAKVIDFRVDAPESRIKNAEDTSFYIKCIPMHWPLNNVPGECTFEEWIRLDGNVVIIRDRLVNSRPDRTQFQARGQELPAIYTNGPWYRLISYTGDAPFCLAPTKEFTEKPPNSTFPWVGIHANESWAALVDKDGDGLGIVEPGIMQFSGGFFGEPGKGGPSDSPTGYIAPNAVDILDSNISYEFTYDLVVGSLDQIRRRAYVRVPRPEPPIYLFQTDRQHWSYINCEDAGWPVRGELNVKMEKNDPQLIGPVGFWRAGSAPKLTIEAAFSTHGTDAQVFWSRSDTPGFAQARSVIFTAIPDGKFHRYIVNLASSPEYRGVITQLRFDPEPSGAPGDEVRIRSIGF
ncbi:MAG: hypothetical protein ACHQ50_11965 [Fimbriimonadales bacterium]